MTTRSYSASVSACCLTTLTRPSIFFFFFFNDTATTEIYTLSLHDALPISILATAGRGDLAQWFSTPAGIFVSSLIVVARSEEHTSELQSLAYLVCRLLLEKKKKKKIS